MDINVVEIRKLSYGDLDPLTMIFGSEFNRTHQDDLIDQEQELISFYVAWLQNNPIGHALVMTEKLLFGFAERSVRDDGVIPMWQNRMWFEIDKCLLFTGNMIASCILFSIPISTTA